MSILTGSSILVTGGTGSFGKAFIADLLARHDPKRVVVFSRDELKQYECRQLFGDDPRLRWFIGDIRDPHRLHRAMHGVEYVVHAAALKQVDTAEYNPWEFVQTNIIGSQNVIEACIDAGVTKVVALSTDKASSPINLYGATKLTADKLFITGNHYAAAYPTRFSVVRYGNVMGSRGSVIPYFRKLAEAGQSLPITDLRCTRFFITLPQAVQLVLDAFEHMQGGELYVPRIPSMRVTDLAQAIAPGAAMHDVGLRPGEKLHEEMISPEEGRRALRIGERFVIQPDLASWGYTPPADGVPVSEGFHYTSENNDEWFTREEIAAILDAAIRSLPDDMRADAAPNGTRDAAIDAAVGLTGEEAASCYARSIVQCRKIDPILVSKEKKRVIARERVLEWFDPLPGGLDAVGGLENLKTWLVARSAAYSPQARDYGLPAPKGAMLAGIPGCGKSLTAKAIATAWGVPLLRVDLGGLKSKFVGESESNLRKAFKVIEAIGRCVVWLDEIEKALQGATSGAADGGVSSDALGAILNWMQERSGEAFVIATANDVEGLPPELLRKGRFDEVWWVDLPTRVERLQILNAALNTHKRKLSSLDSKQHNNLLTATEGFTGSEIAALVPDALFAAFADGARELTARDLLDAAKTVVPLSKTAEEKLTRLRNWAKGRARPAGTPESISQAQAGERVLDL